MAMMCARTRSGTARAGVVALSLGSLMGMWGCENAGQGALSGGLLGAGTGAIVGSAFGDFGKGALIGGAVGALGGAVIGDQNDRRARAPYSGYETRSYYVVEEHYCPPPPPVHVHYYHHRHW